MLFNIIHSLFLFISVFIYISFTQGHFRYSVIFLQKQTSLIMPVIPNCYTEQPGYKRQSDDRLMWKASKKIFQCNHWLFSSDPSKDSYWLSRAVYWSIWFPAYQAGLFLWHCVALGICSVPSLRKLWLCPIGLCEGSYCMNKGGCRVRLVLSTAWYQWKGSNSTWLVIHIAIITSTCCPAQPYSS